MTPTSKSPDTFRVSCLQVVQSLNTFREVNKLSDDLSDTAICAMARNAIEERSPKKVKETSPVLLINNRRSVLQVLENEGPCTKQYLLELKIHGSKQRAMNAEDIAKCLYNLEKIGQVCRQDNSTWAITSDGRSYLQKKMKLWNAQFSVPSKKHNVSKISKPSKRVIMKKPSRTDSRGLKEAIFRVFAEGLPCTTAQVYDKLKDRYASAYIKLKMQISSYLCHFEKMGYLEVTSRTSSQGVSKNTWRISSKGQDALMSL